MEQLKKINERAGVSRVTEWTVVTKGNFGKHRCEQVSIKISITWLEPLKLEPIGVKPQHDEGSNCQLGSEVYRMLC